MRQWCCMVLFHVTQPYLLLLLWSYRHGDELPLEIERLWSTLAGNRRNIIPILDFLASLGTHMAYQVSKRQLSSRHMYTALH